MSALPLLDIETPLSRFWMRVTKFDRRAVALADRHYSRRKPGSPQFMPPGQTVVLLTEDARAVFGWWRPDPSSGLRALNGLDGWTCTIFRNEGDVRSSDLILDAEWALASLGVSCGPDGWVEAPGPERGRAKAPLPEGVWRCSMKLPERAARLVTLMGIVKRAEKALRIAQDSDDLGIGLNERRRAARRVDREVERGLRLFRGGR